MKLNNDALICHVQHVNQRMRKNGEDEVLACDIKLRVMEPDDWAVVAAAIWDIDQTKAAEMLHSLGAMKLGSIAWDVDGTDHVVHLKHGNKKMATVTNASINKVVFRWGADLGMTLRVQADASGELIGQLATLLHTKVRLATKWQGVTVPDGEEQVELVVDSTTEETAEV